ncbi:MAG: hypothetical protein MAG458_01239 [Nitrosopumilus sp.]|nr:hypothetical protein [Nitrosopumilus sp.]
MVTDKNETYEFSKDKRESLLSTAFATCLDILETCKHIAHDFDKPNKRTKYFCAGLYTHALEEYGKILYLKNLPVENDVIKIDYRKYGGHKTKFSLVDDDAQIPEICKKFFGDKRWVGKPGDEATAVLQSTIPVDQITRFQIFYSDFEDNGNIVRYPDVDKEKLREAIDELWLFIFNAEREYMRELELKKS